MPKDSADVENLISAVGLLVRRLRAEGASHELSWTERIVMARLAKHGATTIAELARAEGMKPQSMGATIADLEAAGMVGRKPHPTDKRQSLITLSAQGVAVLEVSRKAKHAWLEQAIATLARGERDTLFAAAQIIARLGQAS